MTTERDLIQSLTNALEVLHKEAVTAPYSQTLVIGGIAHPIPIGNDLLARDAIYADLLARAYAYLSQPEPEGPTVMEIIELADEIEAEELGQVDLVRRALARWGHLAQSEPERPPLEPRGCPTPGACSCPTSPIVPPELIRALELAEAALADIGDAEREPSDDLAWAEARAAQDLPRIRVALARWGRPATTTETP